MFICELDEERWEVRKVEIYADGHCGFASADESAGGADLGELQVPPLAEIAADSEFEPAEITRDYFEQIWAQRHGVYPPP
jgi:hypothetical protein